MRLRLVGVICCSMSLTSSVEVNAQGVQVRDGKVTLSGFGDVDIERTLEFLGAAGTRAVPGTAAVARRGDSKRMPY